MQTLAHLPPPSNASLSARLSHFMLLEPVFDALPDVAFFVKDEQARYVMVNQTLAERCGKKEKRALLGKTAEEVLPARFGHVYTAQDKTLIARKQVAGRPARIAYVPVSRTRLVHDTQATDPR